MWRRATRTKNEVAKAREVYERYEKGRICIEGAESELNKLLAEALTSGDIRAEREVKRYIEAIRRRKRTNGEAYLQEIFMQ